ncbi:hypothetical protein [Tabrizicola sp.]|uniref:hypothetical protein n=1 Tax=Tabrizicola sp. TaxID=2005166 RepID=UPI003F2A5CB4
MLRALAFALLAPIAAQAACPDTTVLACTVAGGTKVLEVCLAGSDVSYSFGPASGPAEMALATRLGPGVYSPSTDQGRYKYQGLRISNASHAYESWFAYDSLDPQAAVEAGVHVMDDDRVVETALCDPGSITFDFTGLGPATEATGYCWDDSSYDWAEVCD